MKLKKTHIINTVKLINFLLLIFLFNTFLTIRSNCRASGFQTSVQGHKERGLGHIGTAMPLGASALFFNPGSAAFVSGNVWSMGGSIFKRQVAFWDLHQDVQINNENRFQFPFYAYGLYRIDRWSNEEDGSVFKAGIGIYSPFDNNMVYPEDWTGRFLLQKMELHTVYVQPSFSYKINDHIGFGGGIIIATGNVQFRKALPITAENGAAFDSGVSFKGKGLGYAYNLGVFAEPLPNFTIGFNYRSRANIDVKNGKVDFVVPQSLQDYYSASGFSSRLIMPDVTSLGLAYYFNKKNEDGFYDKTKANFVSLELNRTGWEAYRSLKFSLKETETKTAWDMNHNRLYNDNYTLKAGGQWAILPDRLLLRAGFNYDTYAPQNDNVSPETPDGDKFIYSGGIGIGIIENLDIDLSFTYAREAQNRTTHNLSEGFAATYNSNYFATGVGLEYKF